MNLDFPCRFLLWCLAANYTILLVWFFAFVFARDWIYRLHARWFSLQRGTFDAIHYGGMAAYKLAIFLFNLVPLVALCLAR